MVALQPNSFEIYLFGFGNPPQSNLFDEIKNKNNIYIDLSDKSDDEAVELVRKKKLDFFTPKKKNLFQLELV